MVDKITQIQGSTTGSLGEAGKAGKGGAKGGLFAALIASFQQHIKQAETHLQVDGQKTSSHEKIAVNGLKTTLLNIDPESVAESGQAKSLLKAHVDKTTVGEHVKGSTDLSTKSLLQNSKTQALVKKNSEQQDVFNTEVLVDDTEKLQKHGAIGLGVFQQESREPITKTVGGLEAKEEIFTGLEGKKNKNTENNGKSPRLVMNIQDPVDQKAVPVGQSKTEKLVGKAPMNVQYPAEQKAVPVGQNKTEKLVGKVPVSESKSVEIGSAKQAPQGRFSLNNTDTIDDAIDVSKPIKRDESVSLKNQSKGEDISAKPVSLASAGNTIDDGKAVSADEGNVRQGLNANLLQGKQVKNGRVQQGLGLEENASKIKSPFKTVAANRSGIAGTQAQPSMLVVSNIQGDAIIKSSGGQDANMAGDDRGMGRSAAEILMADGSIRDTRSTRSDFAMQMAYRSAASFKPSDAMLEISKAAKDGTVKLDLMLEPATLGKIQISLQTDAQKQIQVHLIVDQQASRQVLEQQLPQLRQALADQGLNLSGFTMDMNSQQQNDGKASDDVAGMDHMNSHGESENVMSLEAPLRMGVNVADDGSLSILA